METANVILVKSNPKDVVDLMDLSKKTYRKMVQKNLWWTTGQYLCYSISRRDFSTNWNSIKPGSWSSLNEFKYHYCGD